MSAKMTNEAYRFFRCQSCGFAGDITMEEIAKHRSRCAFGTTEPTEPSPEVKQEETLKGVCVYCDKPVVFKMVIYDYVPDRKTWVHVHSNSVGCDKHAARPRPSPEVAPMQRVIGAKIRKRQVVEAVINPTVAEIMGVADGDHFSADMAGDGSNFIVADGTLWIRESVAAKALMRSEDRLMIKEASHDE